MYSKIGKKMQAHGVDALLLSSPENMRYVSGFTGEGLLYLSKDKAVILTDFRYIISAKSECKSFEIVDVKGKKTEFLSRLLEKKELRVGYESNRVTVAEHKKWTEDLAGVEWIPFEKILADLRSIKSKDEIKKIARAEAIGDKAFMNILDLIKVGISERKIAWQLEVMMREFGAQGLSFDTIVASGFHSSMPHAVPTDKKIQKGDFITLDFGCKVDGYCSDMTRTIVVGSADSRQKEIYNLVLEAQETALKGIRSDVKCNEVDAMARNLIEQAGYGDMFGHGLGHSVGLEIHEEPRFSPNVKRKTEKGMVITVEPGIYMEGLFGVRIEDLVVITEDGYKNLAHSPKELIEL